VFPDAIPKRLDYLPVLQAQSGDRVLVPLQPMQYDEGWARKLVKGFQMWETSPHGWRYRCRRRGLLDEIPHRRLIRRVLVVRTEDAGRVVELLEEMGAEVHARRVELTREDREAMRDARVSSTHLPR